MLHVRNVVRVPFDEGDEAVDGSIVDALSGELRAELRWCAHEADARVRGAKGVNEAGVGAASCGTEEGQGRFGSRHHVDSSGVGYIVVCSWSKGSCCDEVLL